MSWKPEVRTVKDPKWYSNALVFATEQEAKDSASDLMYRWGAVEECRAVEVDEPVNYSYIDQHLIPVTGMSIKPFHKEEGSS